MDLVSTLATVLTLLAFPAIAVVAGRLLDRDGESRPMPFFERSWEMGWPRGVQEDEPIRYRVELIGQAAFSTAPQDSRHEGVVRLARFERERAFRSR